MGSYTAVTTPLALQQHSQLFGASLSAWLPQSEVPTCDIHQVSPASCDMLYACPVIALLSCVSCVCLCYCMCLFDELCALHGTSVTLLAQSVQIQLFLLRNVCQNVD